MPSKSTYMAVIEVGKPPAHKLFHKRLDCGTAGEGEVSLTANGTLSLFLALKVGGAVAGRKIITTPFKRIEWIGCTIRRGRQHRQRLSTYGGGTGRSRYGAPCDHAGLESVCAPASVPIIYDAAHSFASKINGRPVLTRWAARRRRVFTPSGA